jgi:hypothetical protein
MMFLSSGRGARASSPPVQNTFQEVFQGRLLTRRASRDTGLQGAVRRSFRLGSHRETDPRLELGRNFSPVQSHQGKGESALQGAARPGESHQTFAASVRKPREKPHQTQKQPESQVAIPGLGADNGLSSSPPPQPNNTAASTNPPPALRQFIAFLQSLPNGNLKIPAGEAPAVAAFLRSAGLPQEEVARLLPAGGSLEKSLSAADLEAAWQRYQEMGSSPGPQATSGQSLGKTDLPPENLATPAQSLGGANLPPEAHELIQSPEYQRLWERLTLPESMLPILRLALARLGGSPEQLAQLEEAAQANGIPLARVWQILQKRPDSLTLNEPSNKGQSSPGEDFSQSAIIGKHPVRGEEVEEWRQVLLKAGLTPEVVEKLLGRVTPANQEELKTALLALAPPGEQPPTAAEPKPLYLPGNLTLRPFLWQDQAGGDQPHLNGNTAGEKQPGAPAELTSSLPAGSPGEAFGPPAFPIELQALTPGEPSSGAPLSNTLPAWRFLAPEVRESLWSQLRSGIISNLVPGESQVSLSLNPPELGQIQLTLRLSGQELAVTAVATRPEVAEMATFGVQQLLQALAQQGLVLTQFQVRLQDQPARQPTPVLAGAREKGSEPGERSPTSSRRRSGEVDCFV